MESFKEFCEGWIGGANGSRPYQRNELFNILSLKSQYDQLIKAINCNVKRGAVKLESLTGANK